MKNKSDKSAKKSPVIHALSTIILLLAVIFCFTTMVQVLTNGYASFFGYSMFRVVTGSMEPEIPVSALIISRRSDIGDIAENDIVCFRSKDPAMLGQTITHRVVGVTQTEDEETSLQTKGDANVSVDSYFVTSHNLIGKVVWVSSDSNIMAVTLSIITDKFGFFTVIIIPVLLIITLVLNSSIRKIKAELDLKKKEIEESEADNDTVEKPDESISEENYQEMYERIKAEMMEEKVQDETEESKTEQSPDEDN